MNTLLIILIIFIPFIILLKLLNITESFESTPIYNKHLKLLKQSDKNKVKNNLSNIPIYVINLKRAVYRKKFMEEQSKFLDIKINFIEGIDGNNIQNLKNGSFMLNNINIKYTNLSSISNYELACFLSHIKSLLTAYFNNLDYILILEDDVSMSLISKWNTTIKNIIQNAPSDWDGIALFCINKRNNNEKYINTKFWGAQANLYNKKGIEKIINKIYDKNTKTINIIENCAVDHYVQRISNMYMYNEYLFAPINDTNKLDSLIHTAHTSLHNNKAEKILNYYL